jgi:hypothetical protein
MGLLRRYAPRNDVMERWGLLRPETSGLAMTAD